MNKVKTQWYIPKTLILPANPVKDLPYSVDVSKLNKDCLENFQSRLSNVEKPPIAVTPQKCKDTNIQR